MSELHKKEEAGAHLATFMLRSFFSYYVLLCLIMSDYVWLRLIMCEAGTALSTTIKCCRLERDPFATQLDLSFEI